MVNYSTKAEEYVRYWWGLPEAETGQVEAQERIQTEIDEKNNRPLRPTKSLHLNPVTCEPLMGPSCSRF